MDWFSRADPYVHKNLVFVTIARRRLPHGQRAFSLDTFSFSNIDKSNFHWKRRACVVRALRLPRNELQGETYACLIHTHTRINTCTGGRRTYYIMPSKYIGPPKKAVVTLLRAEVPACMYNVHRTKKERKKNQFVLTMPFYPARKLRENIITYFPFAATATAAAAL